MSWQEKLDTLFPFGCSVVHVADVPEDVRDSVSFLTPRLIVKSEDGDQVHITCNALEFDKDISFTMVKLEEMTPGLWLVHTPEQAKKAAGSPPAPVYLLSSNVAGPLREALEQARKEWFPEEASGQASGGSEEKAGGES